MIVWIKKRIIVIKTIIVIVVVMIVNYGGKILMDYK